MAAKQQKLETKYNLAFQSGPEPELLLDWPVEILERALGKIKPGRIYQLWGADSTGKSTIVMLIALKALAKKLKLRICYLDAEGDFDWPYFTLLGYNEQTDKEFFKYAVPETAEDALEYIIESMRQNLHDIYIVDSIAGLTSVFESVARTKADDKPKRDTGIHSRAIAGKAKKISSLARRLHKYVFVTNQVRVDLHSWHVGEQTTGGWALRHHSAARIKVAVIAKAKDYMIAGFRVDKSKVSKPGCYGQYKIGYGTGFDKPYDDFWVKVLKGEIVQSNITDQEGKKRYILQGSNFKKSHSVEWIIDNIIKKAKGNKPMNTNNGTEAIQGKSK